MKPGRFQPLGPADASYLLAQVEAFEPDWTLVLPYVPYRARGPWLCLLAFACEVVGAPGRVSNPMLGQIRLQWWREALEEIFGDGEPRRHPTVLGLAATVGSREGIRGLLEAVIDGAGAFLAPGEDRDIEEAVRVRHAVYGPLASALASVSETRQGGEGLALHALSRSAPDGDAVADEDGVEPPARRFARALGRDPSMEAALAERIADYRRSERAEAFALPALPLRLVTAKGGSVRRIRNPLAQKTALFRGVLTGRV